MYDMNNPTTTNPKEFLLPSMAIESDFTQEELAEDMDGLQLGFPRVKIPGGGALQFEIPTDDPDDPDYQKTLEGIILYNHDSYAYWPESDANDDDAVPMCSSNDGKIGTGDPGGACAVCALNRFGTAANGTGKACKNMRMLYLLQSGALMPIQLALPPTSLKPFREFMRHFMIRRRALYGSLVQIGLKKVSNGKDDYSIATFRCLYDFTGEELAQVRAYADSFREQIKAMLQQRTTAQEGQRDDGCDYANAPLTLPAAQNEQFCYGQTIDGEREALPA